MGFLSRILPREAANRPVPGGRISQSLGESSSPAPLAADPAAHGMTPRDIDQAIARHERWVPWLEQALHGAADARLRPEVIEHEDCSELGQWLRGSGQQALGHLPAFGLLVRRNRFFHAQAAQMLVWVAAGDTRGAERAFKACRHASTQMVLLLKELRRCLARNL